MKGENSVMGIILFVVVGYLCISQGIKTYQMKDLNKVFSKYPIRVKDVKEYNQFCGKLMIGFGIVAEITLVAMLSTKGWVSVVIGLCIVLESVILMKIYRKREKDFIEKK